VGSALGAKSTVHDSLVGAVVWLFVLYRLANNCQGAPGGHYFILLVLTDGVISDNDETREAIVNVSVVYT